MITKFKIFESVTDREVIYTFKTKAITHGENKDYEYTVKILQGKSEFHDDFDHMILSVENTPGSWYLSTLMEHDSFHKSYAVIDGGSNWTIDNWDKISKEFFEILPKLEMIIQTNKYNL